MESLISSQQHYNLFNCTCSRSPDRLEAESDPQRRGATTSPRAESLCRRGGLRQKWAPVTLGSFLEVYCSKNGLAGDKVFSTQDRHCRHCRLPYDRIMETQAKSFKQYPGNLHPERSTGPQHGWACPVGPPDRSLSFQSLFPGLFRGRYSSTQTILFRKFCSQEPTTSRNPKQAGRFSYIHLIIVLS